MLHNSVALRATRWCRANAERQIDPLSDSRTVRLSDVLLWGSRRSCAQTLGAIAVDSARTMSRDRRCAGKSPASLSVRIGIVGPPGWSGARKVTDPYVVSLSRLRQCWRNNGECQGTDTRGRSSEGRSLCDTAGSPCARPGCVANADRLIDPLSDSQTVRLKDVFQ